MSYSMSLCLPAIAELIDENGNRQPLCNYSVSENFETYFQLTYNFHLYFYDEDTFGEGGLKGISGMTGAESIPIFKSAISAISNRINSGVWPRRPDGEPLGVLAGMLHAAELRPDGVWSYSP